MDADHPRACGENLASTGSNPSIKGSPPRVRGKLRLAVEVGVSRRITPARAGKTWVAVTVERCREDHPRACGENLVRIIPPGFCHGSPPRVRGKPEGRCGGCSVSGITPARAGKT